MFFDPLEIPERLLDAQENGKLVIFAGAGVSMGGPSNLPSFKGLAKQIAGNNPLANDLNRYDTRLDRFLSDLSHWGVKVHELCAKIIGAPDSEPTNLHRSLVRLFRSSDELRIVTTNFDDHFSKVISERHWTFEQHLSPALLNGDSFRGLVYLHGSIKRMGTLILTAEDFRFM